MSHSDHALDTHASEPSELPPETAAEAKWKPLRIAGAVAMSIFAIWAATRFEREAPASEVGAPGLTMLKDGVSLTRDAPQWKSLRLGLAQPLSTFSTDPVPARVKIDETRASKLGSPLQGRVTQVFVELGQKVKTGTPLFAVASQDITTLRAEKEKADVDLDAARVNLDRVKAMVAARALPAKEETLAQQQLKQAEVAAKAAGTKLSALSVSGPTEGGFTVNAMRDGVVVEKNVLVGQEVSPEAGASLVTIADLSAVWVLADIFEADAISIREGSKARITSPSLPGQVIEGVVEMVSAVVDPERHTVPVRIRVKNEGKVLRPNVYAEVRIDVPPPEGAVQIAATALVTDGNHQYVYVEEANGKFIRREIVAGSVHDGTLAVFKGLKAGESIVEEGGILLDNQLALAN